MDPGSIYNFVPGDARGGKGQYCLINVASVREGGSGAAGPLVSSLINGGGTNTLVSIASTGAGQGALRNVSQTGAAAQITTSVALPMPSNLRTSYGADWTVDAVGLAERTGAAVADSAARLYREGNLNDLSVSGLVAAGEGNGLNQLTNYVNSTAFRKSLKDQFGLAYNPHKEVFYGGPRFRTLPMEWRFMFETKDQADSYKKMVTSLAAAMHPDFIDGAVSGVWKIPDTVYVDFVNAQIPKYGAMVIAGLESNVTNASGWRAFEDGNPAHVSLQMLLLEIAPRTKQDVLGGM